jgi:hypothetical protein
MRGLALLLALLLALSLGAAAQAQDPADTLPPDDGLSEADEQLLQDTFGAPDGAETAGEDGAGTGDEEDDEIDGEDDDQVVDDPTRKSNSSRI